MGTDTPKARVKALPWRSESYQGEETRLAKTVVGEYAAWEKNGEGRVIVPGLISSRAAGRTIEDAMAEAQADFEARILSALEM